MKDQRATGTLCLTTKHILEENRAVGYMYRTEPDHDEDSGWRFLSGDESEEEMESDGFVVASDTSTVADLDPSICEHLGAPLGSHFARLDDSSALIEVEGVADDEE